MNKLFESIFYNISKGFQSENALLKAARQTNRAVTRKDVKSWLQKQPTYTLHKPARKNYVRNKVLVSGIDEQWQADLVDLQSLSKFNDGFKYLLMCIDIFSKYAWAVPLKSKSAGNTIMAFEVIFSSGRKPYKLQTDEGKEFVNKEVQKFLKTHFIDFFTTKSETKASVVERFNRTLKERMWRIFTKRNTYRYIDFLDSLLKNYNSSYHRTIGMPPVNVSAKNEQEILNKAYRIHSNEPFFKFEIGDKVRLSKLKRHFEKGYWPNWTEEYFTVKERFSRRPPVYILKDQLDETLEGVFYEAELQKIETEDKDLYVIEKVIKTRKRNNKTEYFVKWRGYPNKFNSWTSKVVFV